jgi:hypothetical protein
LNTTRGNQVQINTFDLTFNGTILPDHDPKQVKADFAQMFCIEDPSLLKELFSGETVILRTGLERKTAGSYYRKLQELGSEATLVSSGKQHAKPGDVILKLILEPPGPPRITREVTRNYGMDREILIRREGEIDKSWPVSSSKIKSMRHKSPTTEVVAQETVAAPVAPVETYASQAQNLRSAPSSTVHIARLQKLADREQEAANKKAKQEACSMVILESAELELDRLQQQRQQTVSSAQEEVSRLKNLEAEVNHITTQKMENIEEMAETASTQANEEVSRLRQLALDKSQENEGEIAKLQELEQEARERSEATIAKLETQKNESTSRALLEINQLEETRQDNRRKAEDDIARLEQQLKDIRHQLTMDMEELDQQESDIELMKDHSSRQLDQEIALALDTEQAEIAPLREAGKAATQRTEEQLARLQELQLQAMDKKNVELAKLTSMELDVRQECKDSLAKLQEGTKTTQSRAEQQLQRLKKMEQEIRDKENEELLKIRSGQ